MDQWRTLTFRIQHPLLALLLCLDFFVCRSTVRFFFTGILLTENRLWKRVPSETEFAWLPPDIASAFCSDALRRRSDCQYLAFHEAHMGLHGRAFQTNFFIVDMVFLGDTRSAEELAVFTNMAPERLCLGCGLRVDEKFTPIFPGERGPLFAASVKLLQFALRVSSASAFAKELTEEEEAFRKPFGRWWWIRTATSWRCLLCWFSPS